MKIDLIINYSINLILLSLQNINSQNNNTVIEYAVIHRLLMTKLRGIQNKLENRVVEMLNNNEVKLQGSKY